MANGDLLIPGSYEEQLAQARALQNRAFQQATAQIDPAALEALAKRRALAGVEQEGMGAMMTAQGPEALRPLGRAMQARGLEAREPWEAGGGILHEGRFTADPEKGRERLTRALAAQAAAAKGFAGEAGDQEGRVLARALQRQQLATGKQALEAGKWMKIKGPDDREYLYNTTTRQIVDPAGGAAPGAADGAPGRTFPAQASPRASEDERRTAYQVQGLATRAGGIDPRYAGPGLAEAAARTVIPGEAGEAVANFLSSGPRQQARQSQEGMVDSLLYLATGAAYNKEQLTQARREFLPAYTDKPETIAAKRAKLAQLAESARNRAGRAWTAAQEAQLVAAFPELGQPGQQAAAGGTRPGAAPRRDPRSYMPAGSY